MSRDLNKYPRRGLGEFSEGDVREQAFVVNRTGLQNFVLASGDDHPVHTDVDFAVSRGYKDVLVHGMCITARCSAFIAREVVGSHGLLVAMSADYRLPVFCDDSLVWRAEVANVDTVAETVQIKWAVYNHQNMAVQRGTACAWLGDA